MMTFRGILLLSSLLAVFTSQAQTFQGYAELGPNLNQIQGDDLAGWNRIGIFAGVGVMTDLADRWRASVTIAYSQYGSRASGPEVARAGSIYDKVSLDYVAVPIKIHYMDWLSADETFYHLEFYAGAEYLQLISQSAVGLDGTDLILSNPYRNAGANALAGAYYVWSLKWAAGLSYHSSLTPMQEQRGEQNQFLKQLGFRLRRTF